MLVLIAGLVTGLTVSIPLQAQCSKSSDCSEKFVALVRLARQPDGLHKAALANGGTFESGGGDPPKGIYDLPSLAVMSTIIVSAKVLKSESILVNEGRDIETLSTLQITQIFKGQSSEQLLHLSMRGGAYTFPDGSKATQTEDIERPLVENVEYILFLERAQDRPNLYYPTAWTGQDVFEVARDGSHLFSHTYLRKDPLRDEAKAGREAFVQRLQKLIASQR